MTYSLTTGISYFEHMQTISAIERSGRRVETAIHSGLMSLATAQARAMKEFGTKIDDRLVEIDETINSRFAEIKFCLEGVSEQLGHGFTAMKERLGDIDKTLARLDINTSNPEWTRAQERFRRALELYKAGHFAPALENVDHAIANDGGPRFAHISEFQALKGALHMGNLTNPERSVIDPAKAHKAFLAAANYYTIQYTRDRPDRADLYYQAGLAAYAAGNPMAAIQAHRQALEDYEPASKDDYGRTPCYAHFQIARSCLAIGDVPLVRKHLVQAIDMNWKLLAAVAADPDFIAHHDVIEPIVSAYVKETLPVARRELEALCFILVGGAPRNVSKMHEKLHRATLPDDVEGDTSHSSPISYEDATRFEWSDESNVYFYSPYPAGLTDGQSRAIAALLRNDAGLLDIATVVERLDSEYVLIKALRRTSHYWRAINGKLKQGSNELKGGRLPGVLPSFRIQNVPEQPRLETAGGFIARKRAKKQYETALAERKRALAAAHVIIERDQKKVCALASRELPGVFAQCKDMAGRSQIIQERAERALKTLHPERRWKTLCSA